MAFKITTDGKTSNLEGLSAGDNLEFLGRIEVVENYEVDRGLYIIKTLFLTHPTVGTTVRHEYFASEEMILEGNLRIGGSAIVTRTKEPERKFYEKSLVNPEITVQA